MENSLDTIPHTLIVSREGAEFLLNSAGDVLWVRDSSHAHTPRRAPASTKIGGIKHKITLWQEDWPPTVSPDSAWRVREILLDWGLVE